MLGMPDARVRELAREALASLAPPAPPRVDAELARPGRRLPARPADAAPRPTATRGHLRRSEAARAWARSLLDSLSHLYPNGDLPAIPDPDDAAPSRPRPRRSAAGREGRERPPTSRTRPPRPRRRRLDRRRRRWRRTRPAARARSSGVGGSSAAGERRSARGRALITGVVGGGGGDDKPARRPRSAPPARAPRPRSSARSCCARSATRTATGSAVVIMRRHGKPELIVQATG